MESGSRKKRTLAERRESDKLRQRRFREKKRKLLQIQQEEFLKTISITAEVVEEQQDSEQKGQEKAASFRRRTAEQIRETNRIRQQRFRAKKRLSLMGVEIEDDRSKEVIGDGQLRAEDIGDISNPEEFLKNFLEHAVNVEKERNAVCRREKDRMRKKLEREKKKGIQTIGEFAKLLTEDVGVEAEAVTPEPIEENTVDDEVANATFLAQLEKMGIVLPNLPLLPPSSSSSSTPDLQEASTSSAPPTPPFVITAEKKPWQRCSTSEERRERERMRKRMYRAKQKYMTTGKLEMQWDPAPIKRVPDDEEGITPLPEWSATLTSEQKAEAHRIYNRRYRERIKSTAASQKEPKPEEELAEQSEVPPELFNHLISLISQSDMSSLVSQSS